MTTGYGGTYRAVVVDSEDPAAQGRIQVTVPEVGLEAVWASPMGASSDGRPGVGDEVEVQFEGGDTDHPVWQRTGAGGSGTSGGGGYTGVYRAIVVDNADPQQLNRLHVEVPEVLGATPTWASPTASYSSGSDLPAVGAAVWVHFAGGSADHPEWSESQ